MHVIKSLTTKTRTGRQAFTLLELLLALSLSVVILMAIGMAIHLHMRSLDSQRAYLEESQLARSLLRMIADDIRGVALRYEQDVSSVEELLKGAAQSAAGELLAGVGDPELASGIDTELEQPPPEGESGGETEDASQSTQDLSTTVTLPAMPGIVGNQYQLQIDLSRLPRLEEYQQMMTESDAMDPVRDIPSDVKTVTYFVQAASATGSGTTGQALALDQLTDPELSSGLVRRELDRAVTNWALTSSLAPMVNQGGDLIAPEVVSIEFQYFDGVEWRLEWDTELEQALPLAIQISLAMQSMEATESAAESPVAATNELTAAQTGLQYYRLVVQLPVGLPAEASSEGEEEDLEGTGI